MHKTSRIERVFGIRPQRDFMAVAAATSVSPLAGLLQQRRLASGCDTSVRLRTRRSDRFVRRFVSPSSPSSATAPEVPRFPTRPHLRHDGSGGGDVLRSGWTVNNEPVRGSENRPARASRAISSQLRVAPAARAITPTSSPGHLGRPCDFVCSISRQ